MDNNEGNNDNEQVEAPSILPRELVPSAPFDPEPQRERIRGWIALSLLVLLSIVLVLAFISMWVGMNADVLRTVLTIVFGPLVTLVSAATGFYYGSRSGSR